MEERKQLTDYAVKTHSITLHRACSLLNISRSVHGYQAKKVSDEVLRKLLQQLTKQYPRYGFGKLFPLVRKEGYLVNHKRLHRIYCENGFNLKRKIKKRLAGREKVHLIQPLHINETWSLDFMIDALIHRQRFRTLNILDDGNREALGIKVAHSIPATAVTHYLDAIACWRGYPKNLRVDNGPENTASVTADWAKKHGVNLIFIQPGKPAQNGYIERFNRTYREEVLNMYLFKNIQEVQRLTDKWLREYNEKRPHKSLGNLTPREFGHKYLKQINDFLYEPVVPKMGC